MPDTTLCNYMIGYSWRVGVLKAEVYASMFLERCWHILIHLEANVVDDMWLGKLINSLINLFML